MDLKKIGKHIIFPHIAIMFVLLPTATVFLVYSMIFVGTESIVAKAVKKCKGVREDGK